MQKCLNAVIVALLAIVGFSSIALTTEEEQGADYLRKQSGSDKAFAIFERILNLTEASDRKKNIPQIETAYREIIEQYPAASIAEECYWRLALIYLNDYDPPQFRKAETLYREFMRKYPESSDRYVFSDAISESYHEAHEWKRLMKFHSPVIKKFIEGEKLLRPTELFMYSEAKFHMGDLAEAGKGYNIVITLFPESGESRKAKKMLDIINEKKSPSP